MEGHSRKADRYLLLVMGKDERRWGETCRGLCCLFVLCQVPKYSDLLSVGWEESWRWTNSR